MSARVHPTIEQLAKIAGVSRRTMFKAVKLNRTGAQLAQDAVMSGRVSLNTALLIAQFNEDSQRLILDEIGSIPAKRQSVFVQMLLADAGVHACTEGAV